MGVIVPPDGPTNAKILVCGEAPGEYEERECRPFVGPSGQELNRMLGEAGILRSEVFCTNVARERPPNNDISLWFAKSKKARTAEHTQVGDRWVTRQIVEGIALLKREIELVKPNVVIAVGNTSMWALTGKWSITKWRGSMLTANSGFPPVKVIPTYHSAYVLREWYLRAITVADLRRAARFRDGQPYPRPEWKFLVRPSYEDVLRILDQLYVRAHHAGGLKLSFDLETRAGHIACAGVSWSRTDALCIPFMCLEQPGGYWSEDQESEIAFRLYRLLTHPNVGVIGQNLLYDSQYTWRHWHFVPRVVQDTMISQHAMFSDMPKALAFLASMYSDFYQFWKDEGKDWHKTMQEEELWHYNCEDCVYTWEVAEVELATIHKLGLEKVHDAQQAMFWPVLQAMQRGIRIDLKRRNELILEVQDEVARRHQFLCDILGHPLNPGSNGANGQMQRLFYQDLHQPVIMTRAKKGVPARPTLDDDALQKIAQREPLLRPLVNAIADIRTLSTFLSSFLMAKLDDDGRMRCAFNIGGSESGKSAPKTYRLSSGENAFGTGANLQAVPSEKSKSLGKAAARSSIHSLGDPYQFPNIREIFIPDQGYIWFDLDLERADLFVVCWEAGDAQLKAAMRLGVDIHLLNAFVITGKEPPPLEELVETHPRYPDHRGPMKLIREFAKVFCHGCVAEDHEALTPNGWVKVSEIEDSEVIMVCEADGSSAKFERPESWWKGPCYTTMIEFEGEAVNQLVTYDHRLPYRTDATGYKFVAKAVHLPASARLPKSVVYNGPLDHPAPELLAAFHADGSIDTHGNVYWHLKKDRKISRLESLLPEGSYSVYDASDESVQIYLPRRIAEELGLANKRMPTGCLTWSHSTAIAYLNEQVHWDGYLGATNARWMSSIDEERADLCHTLAHIHGHGSQLNFIDRDGRRRLWRWSLNNRTEWRLASSTVRTEEGKGRTVYCPKTSTGFWLTRRKGKISVTGNTNYGGQPRTMAAHTGRTIHEIDRAQAIWFGAHPGIRVWHDRVRAQVTKHHFIENRFGYRWYIFDRIDSIIPEAIAWVPQSTVSIVINKIWQRTYQELPEVQILMQLHDSLPGQLPTTLAGELLPKLKEVSKVVVPYEDPLVIPVSIRTSERSWGDC